MTTRYVIRNKATFEWQLVTSVHVTAAARKGLVCAFRPYDSDYRTLDSRCFLVEIVSETEQIRAHIRQHNALVRMLPETREHFHIDELTASARPSWVDINNLFVYAEVK